MFLTEFYATMCGRSSFYTIHNHKQREKEAKREKEKTKIREREKARLRERERGERGEEIRVGERNVGIEIEKTIGRNGAAHTT